MIYYLENFTYSMSMLYLSLKMKKDKKKGH